MFTGYGDAPVDEVGLAWKAETCVSALSGEIPNTTQLQALTTEHGLDLATMVFYRALLASPAHGDFVREVDGSATEPRPRTAAPSLLIVPAMFHRERPDLGGDGRLIASIARACGFAVATAPTLSRGSVSENAAIIRAALDAHRGTPLWIFSLSKGGGEVRRALQQPPLNGKRPHVRGWINASGIVRGSHFIDHMLASPARRLRARAFCLALGTSYAGAQELRTTHPFWRDVFIPPREMTVINLVGVPLGCHVQKGLVGRYRRLGQLGPNDGFVLLPETLIEPGLIYPIWGSDHLFRSPQVSPLLYRLFNLLQDREAKVTPCTTP